MAVWNHPIRLVIDPRDCGCTDCLVGNSVPMNEVTREQLDAMWPWEVLDRTGTQ